MTRSNINNRQTFILRLVYLLWTKSFAFIIVPGNFHKHRQQQELQQVAYDNDSNANNDDNNNNEFESLIRDASSCSIGNCVGGDFAGLAATFNPSSGAFIPIPDYLIPDILKEWKQEPKCLEVLVSEDLQLDDAGSNNDANAGAGAGAGQYSYNSNQFEKGERGSIMQRTTITILPDTGCAVDNLETVAAKDEIELESQWRSGENHIIESMNDYQNNANNANSYSDDDSNNEDMVGLQYPIGNVGNELRLETIFGVDDDDDGLISRIRVAIDVIPSKENFSIQTPMVITLERRTSSISSGGTIAEGGGLDSRTVSMLLGDRLRRSKTFVDEPTITTSMASSYNNDLNCHPFSNDIYMKEYDTNKNDNEINVVVNLPANISIAYGYNDANTWTIQVGHVIKRNGMKSTRRVVSRRFTTSEDEELCQFEIRSWNEDSFEKQI